MRKGSLRDVARLPQAEVAVAVRPPIVPEGALFAEGQPWRFAVAHDGAVLCGDCASSEAGPRGNWRRQRA